MPATQHADPAEQKTLTLSQPHALRGITVDRESGTIRNVAIITRGPALGHGYDIDDTMLRQVRDALRTNGRTRMHLTHAHAEWGFFEAAPDAVLSIVGHALGDGAHVDKGVVRADIKIGKFAENSPQGDMRAYLLALAEEAPESLGLSIVYDADEFEERRDENDQSLPPAARLKKLVAVDFVGDPGANPNGLLSKARLTKEKEDAMNEELKKYLKSLGLAEGATDAEAVEFVKTLKSGEEIERAKQLGAQSVDLEAARKAAAEEAVKLERQRTSDIKALAERMQLGSEWADKQIADGVSLQAAKDAAIEAVAEKRKPVPAGARDIHVGDDENLATLGAAVGDAILLRALGRVPQTDEDGYAERDESGRVKFRQPHERAQRFRGLSLTELTRKYLSELGADTEGLGRMELAQLVFNRGEMYRRLSGVFGHSSSDFPLILQNVVNKSLRLAYLETPITWDRWARRTTAPDFKEITRVQLGEAPNLPEVGEHREYTEVTIGEAQEKYKLAKYGQIFSLTWETLVNDDLNAFARIPQMMGQAARRREDLVVYAVLNSNPVMADGKQLFSADHKNIATSKVGPPSTDALNEMLEKMRLQEGLTEDSAEPIYLDIEPRFLLAPPALEGTVTTILSSGVKPDGAAAANTLNIWAGRLEPIVTARLHKGSATAWYGVADNSQIDTVEVCFLEEQQQPALFEEDGFAVDGRRYKVRHVVAAKAIDWRGLFKNAGTE